MQSIPLVAVSIPMSRELKVQLFAPEGIGAKSCSVHPDE